MKPNPLLVIALFVVFIGAHSAWGQAFRADHKDHHLEIHCQGAHLADFVFSDSKILRPFFANVRTLKGVPVTRTHPPVPGKDALDHDTMHPGIWLAFGDINGVDFWRNKGTIKHIRFLETPGANQERLLFGQECALLGPHGNRLGRLTNRIQIQKPSMGWMLIWEAKLEPEAGDLILGDQEEMGFGVRVASNLKEEAGGVLVSSEGKKTAKGTWGQPADWCDASPAEGNAGPGITLMAGPLFRKAWWHNRNYGLMVANPFGRQAMKQGAKSAVVVKKGESLTLVFGALVHEGPKYDPKVSYQAFLAEIHMSFPRAKPD